MIDIQYESVGTLGNYVKVSNGRIGLSESKCGVILYWEGRYPTEVDPRGEFRAFELVPGKQPVKTQVLDSVPKWTRDSISEHWDEILKGHPVDEADGPTRRSEMPLTHVPWSGAMW